MTNGYRPEFDLDLKLGQAAESALAGLFDAIDAGHQTLEVKHDWEAIRTGNLYIEFAQTPKGQLEKPSGIAISQADWWAIKLSECWVLVRTPALRHAAREYARLHRRAVVQGGTRGDNPTRGVLLPLDQLIQLVNQAPWPDL